MEIKIDSSSLLSSLPFEISMIIDESGKVIDFNSNLAGMSVKPSSILKHVNVESYIKDGMASVERGVSLFNRKFNMFFTPIYAFDGTLLYMFLFQESSKAVHLDNMRSMFMWFILDRIKYPIGEIREILRSVMSSEKFCPDKELVSMMQNISIKLFELHAYSENVYYLFAIDTGIIRDIYNEEDVNVVDVVKSIVNSISKVYDEKHIYVEVVSEGKVFYRIDRKIIERILENIIGNAFLYSFDNGRITIELKITEEELFIAVTDKGKGMDEAKLQEIFAMFESREHTEIKGTLGLRVTRSLVDFLDGTMVVESEENRGTRVSIHFYKN